MKYFNDKQYNDLNIINILRSKIQNLEISYPHIGLLVSVKIEYIAYVCI